MHEHTIHGPRLINFDQLPQELYSQILPGLFQGGTDDNDTVDLGVEVADAPDERGFDAVVTLYAWANPVGWGVEELRYGFGDAHPDTIDMARVADVARWAHAQWRAGRRVLIRCQAGLNRSGLVTALVMMLDGWTATDAVARIRQQRAPVALCNDHFVDWLVRDAPAALGRIANQ